MDYPTMRIPAKEIRENDWIEGDGLVVEVSHYSTLSWVRCAGDDGRLITPLSPVWVRIEDHGQTE